MSNFMLYYTVDIAINPYFNISDPYRMAAENQLSYPRPLVQLFGALNHPRGALELLENLKTIALPVLEL